MSGLYDRLLDQIGDDDGDEEKSAGLTPLDIAVLPEAQRKVMFALLRDAQASSKGITLEALQAKLQDVEGLPGILHELTRDSWLILMGEPPNTRYKVNLRHRRASTLKSNVWASLTDKLLNDAETTTTPPDQDKGQDKPGISAMRDW